MAPTRLQQQAPPPRTTLLSTCSAPCDQRGLAQAACAPGSAAVATSSRKSCTTVTVNSSQQQQAYLSCSVEVRPGCFHSKTAESEPWQLASGNELTCAGWDDMVVRASTDASCTTVTINSSQQQHRESSSELLFRGVSYLRFNSKLQSQRLGSLPSAKC